MSSFSEILNIERIRNWTVVMDGVYNILYEECVCIKRCTRTSAAIGQQRTTNRKRYIRGGGGVGQRVRCSVRKCASLELQLSNSTHLVWPSCFPTIGNLKV